MAVGNADKTGTGANVATAPAKRRIRPLKKALIAIAAIVVVFVGVVASRPPEFRVTRSITIDAPPSAVFPRVNNFHNWEDWSPWAKLDPAARSTFEGPAAGTGAVFHGAGNEKVGEGGMTTTESRPDELIRIRLEFLKPFAATNTATFTFKPEGDGTAVTWTMEGKNGFLCKAFGLFVDMDKMIGGDFEKGLAVMKSLVETAPKG